MQGHTSEEPRPSRTADPWLKTWIIIVLLVASLANAILYDNIPSNVGLWRFALHTILYAIALAPAYPLLETDREWYLLPIAGAAFVPLAVSDIKLGGLSWGWAFGLNALYMYAGYSLSYTIWHFTTKRGSGAKLVKIVYVAAFVYAGFVLFAIANSGTIYEKWREANISESSAGMEPVFRQTIPELAKDETRLRRTTRTGSECLVDTIAANVTPTHVVVSTVTFGLIDPVAQNLSSISPEQRQACTTRAIEAWMME